VSGFFQFNADASRLRSDLGYEAGIVKKILGRAGLAASEARLRQRCRDVTGCPDLTLAWFKQEYPDFPVNLVARKLPWVHTMDLPMFFLSFTKTKLWSAWQEAMEHEGEESVGLVFPFPKVGDLILHNTPVVPEGPGFVLTMASGRNTVRLDRFTAPRQARAYLDRALEDWSPENTT
jgi:hypothetical protein